VAEYLREGAAEEFRRYRSRENRTFVRKVVLLLK
jgi:hypothetical protein